MALTVVQPKNFKTCGHCAVGHHGSCAVGTVKRDSSIYPSGVVWICGCEEGGCEPGRRKCSDCGNRVTEEVSEETWQCIDRDACHDTIEALRAANPLYAEIQEAYRRSEMAKVENNKAKAEKAAKVKEPTYCLCCGEPTKGGLFLPGHDARHVSTLVESVTSKNQTEAAARKSLKDDKVSDALIAKFDKSLKLAQEKAAKRAEAEKEKSKAKAKS